MSQLIDKLKKLGASSLEIEAIIYSDDINKSLSEFYKKSLEEDLFKAKAAVGEIREWKGIKYQKQQDGTWKPLKGQRSSLPIYEQRFGKNYSEYENNPRGAIEILLKKRKGQVIGAYEKSGLGKIDIIWGNNEKGLQHIRKRHFIDQNDFQSLEDMTNQIVDVLENGKVGKFYDHKRKVDIKTEKFKVVLVRSMIYDEEDNFRDKIWVLTSFDYSRPKEDKIKKNLDCTYPGNSVFQRVLDLGETNSLFGSIDSSYKKGSRTSTIIPHTLSFSEHKDTLKKSLEQHLMRAFLNKKDNILR